MWDQESVELLALPLIPKAGMSGAPGVWPLHLERGVRLLGRVAAGSRSGQEKPGVEFRRKTAKSWVDRKVEI